jgi:hypothetical protein
MYPRFFNAESAVIAMRFVMPASLAILTMLGSRLFAHEMESAHATRIVAPGISWEICGAGTANQSWRGWTFVMLAVTSIGYERLRQSWSACNPTSF